MKLVMSQFVIKMSLIFKTNQNLQYINMHIFFQKTLTPEGTFWFFAANNALSVVFIALFLPETKGKSLEEIETYFQHN